MTGSGLARGVWILIRRWLSTVSETIQQQLWEIELLKRRVTLLPGCKATSVRNIVIGSDVLLSHRTFLQGAGGITVGSNVMIGPEVMLITTGHDKVTRESQSAPIEIESGVWIGARAVILPGVRVGQGSVIAASAVVTRDVPPFSVVGGVPARRIGTVQGDVSGQSYFTADSWLSQF